MTVERLLTEASSRELTAWQGFLQASHEHQEDAAKRARDDAKLMGSDQSVVDPRNLLG